MTGQIGDLQLLVLFPTLMLALVVLSFPRLLDRWRQKAVHAERRARDLLYALLTSEERRHLEQFGCLMIPSPSRRDRSYCVPAHPGMVGVYEAGRLTVRLCLQPVKPLPPSDVVVLLKLMIEGNEEEYLRTANVQPCHGSAR